MTCLSKKAVISIVFLSFFFPDSTRNTSGDLGTHPSISKVLPVHHSEKWTMYSLSSARQQVVSMQFLSASNGLAATQHTVFHFDGAQWKSSSLVPAPAYIYTIAPIPGTQSFLVSGSDEHFRSLLYKYSYDKWSQLPSPFSNYLVTIHAESPNSIWAAGEAEIGFYNGTQWKLLDVPTNYTPLAIYGRGSSCAYLATGNEIYQFDGKSWTIIFSTGEGLKSVVFDPSKNAEVPKIYALTSRRIYQFAPEMSAEERGQSRTKWTEVPGSYHAGRITKLGLTGSGKLVAVGLGGLILHYQNGLWQPLPSPTVKDIQLVTFAAEDQAWIGTDDGLLFCTPKFSLLQQLAANKAGEVIDGFNSFIRKKFPTARNGKWSDEYGVAIGDVNGDGLEDIYTVRIYDYNAAYINQPPQSPGDILPNFVEEASKRRARGNKENIAPNAMVYELGVLLTDFDNDGDGDLYICSLTYKNSFLENDGTGVFKDVTEERGVEGAISDRSNAASAADVDNDGDLDLFVTNEYSSNRLYLNEGNAFFQDVTASAGLATTGGGMQGIFGDIDNDGYEDLFVANWSHQNVLYRNNGDGTFTDITEKAGVGGDPFAKSNAAVFGDIDNDGDLDLFVTNRNGSNCLYRNDGNCHFTDITAQAGLTDTSMSYGAVMADFDNDGFLDIYIANLRLNKLYRNRGNGTFEDATARFDAFVEGYSTGVAAGDLNNDGAVDLYVANYIGEPSMLFINQHRGRDFIKVKLEGTISNRDAIGAKVWLYDHNHAGEREHLRGYREICAGSGYGSTSSKVAHFGTANDSSFDLVVFFPKSGIKRVLKNVKAGTSLTVAEQESLAGRIVTFAKGLHRAVVSPEFYPEMAQFMIAGVLVLAMLISVAKMPGWSVGKGAAVAGALFICYTAYRITIHTDLVLVDNIAPLLIVIGGFVIAYIAGERAALKESQREELERELLHSIRGFFHGEWASSNLNRLELFSKNPPWQMDSPDQRNEAVGRFNAALQAYLNLTYQELRSIAATLRMLRVETQRAATLCERSDDLARAARLLLEGSVSNREAAAHQIVYDTSIIREILSTLRYYVMSRYQCDLLSVLHTVIAGFEPRWRNNGIKWHITTPSPSITVFGRANEIATVFDNVLRNAEESMAKSEKKVIAIDIHIFGDRVSANVCDSGHGIAPELQAQIFEDGVTTKGVGRGEGLAHVKRILQKYAGTVFVKRSNPDTGTCLALELKVVAPPHFALK